MCAACVSFKSSKYFNVDYRYTDSQTNRHADTIRKMSLLIFNSQILFIISSAVIDCSDNFLFLFAMFVLFSLAVIVFVVFMSGSVSRQVAID